MYRKMVGEEYKVSNSSLPCLDDHRGKRDERR